MSNYTTVTGTYQPASGPLTSGLSVAIIPLNTPLWVNGGRLFGTMLCAINATTGAWSTPTTGPFPGLPKQSICDPSTVTFLLTYPDGTSITGTVPTTAPGDACTDVQLKELYGWTVATSATTSVLTASVPVASTTILGSVTLDANPASGNPVVLTAPRLAAASGVASLDSAAHVPLSQLSGITGSQLSATAGIAAGQIASVNPSALTGTGTVPLAALTGITTSQLSATAGIVSGQIASVAAASVTGRLVAGQLPTDAAYLDVAQTWTATQTIPTLYGSSAASGNLTLDSTSNATKGFIYLGGSSAYDGTNIRLGIGTTTPSTALHVTAAGGITAAPPSGTALTATGVGSATGVSGSSSSGYGGYFTSTSGYAGYFTATTGVGLHVQSTNNQALIVQDTGNGISGYFYPTGPGGTNIRVDVNPGATGLLVNATGTGTGVVIYAESGDLISTQAQGSGNHLMLRNSLHYLQAQVDYFGNLTFFETSETGGAPTLAIAAGAGVNTGAHTYAVSWVSSQGETLPGNTAAITVTDTTGVNQAVALSSIPTGPYGTTARKVYRSKAGTTSPLYLVATINDNTTTTYTDTTADASLGAQASAFTTWTPQIALGAVTLKYDHDSNSNPRLNLSNGLLATASGSSTAVSGSSSSGYGGYFTSATGTGLYASSVYSVGDVQASNLFSNSSQTYLGDGAGTGNTASYVVALGSGSLKNNTQQYNTAVGVQALSGGNTGDHNTAVGTQALLKNTSGYQNVALGELSMSANTTGAGNAAIGFGSLSNLIDGSGNMAVGGNALSSLLHGINNVAVGAAALQSEQYGSTATAIGQYALQAQSSQGSTITSFGSSTQGAAYTTVTPASMTGIANGITVNIANSSVSAYNGNWTVSNVQASTFDINATYSTTATGAYWHNPAQGQGNVAIGNRAGWVSISTFSTRLGSNNTFIGTRAALSSSTVDPNCAIAIGYQAMVGGDYAIAIGSSYNSSGSYGATAAYAGSVAIGTDSYGNAASSGAINEIRLGTSSHTTNLPGKLQVNGNISFSGTVYSAGSVGIGTTTPTSALHVNGGVTTALATKTASYTVTTSDSVILVNAASTTVTLPAAGTAGAGRMYTVKNAGSGTSTTVNTGGGTIDGAATDTSLSAAYAVARYVSDGTNYYKV